MKLLLGLLAMMIAILLMELNQDHQPSDTLPGKGASSYPARVNITEVKQNYMSKWNPHSLVPFFFDMKYLERLSRTATVAFEKVLVILGRKDAGKSSALKQLIPLWKSVGHVVIDINLKGECQNVNAAIIMPFVAKQLDLVFKALPPSDYKCVHSYIQYTCAGVKRESNFWIIVGSIGGLLVSIYGGVILIVQHKDGLEGLKNIYNKSVEYMYRLLNNVLIFVIIVIGIILGFDCYYPQLIYESADSLNTTISSGDWKTLVCSLNGISKCVHEKRPILIIREITKFENFTLRSCLQSFDQSKEGDIDFPIIMETSDYYYFSSFEVTKSSSSYEYFEVDNLDYSTAVDMFVKELQLWDETIFDEIYQKLGGLMGLYSGLYKAQLKWKLDVQTALGYLETQYKPVLKEMIKLSYRELCPIFDMLHKDNYTLRIEDNRMHPIFKTISYLINANVLYYGLEYITPQNAIIQKFMEDASQNEWQCKGQGY